MGYMKTLLMILMVLVLCSFVSATNYYFNQSDGSDANTCLINDACQTITKLNTIGLNPDDKVYFNRGDTWRCPIDDYIDLDDGNSTHDILYDAYGTGDLPLLLGSFNYSATGNWTDLGGNLWYSAVALTDQIGNIIVNDETDVLVRQASTDLPLTSQGQWYHNYSVGANNDYLLVYSVGNPATFYSNIEIAEGDTTGGTEILFDINNHEYITIANLSMRYAGFGAVGGAAANGAHHITIRNTDVRFIGGSYHNNVETDRTGNGLSFSGDVHNITVIYNNITEVWDSCLAVTAWADLNQKDQGDINFSYNVLDKCPFAVEYFSSYATSVMKNFYIIHNTMVNNGWAFSGRSDYIGSYGQGDNRGRTLYFKRTPVSTSNVIIRDNIFYNTSYMHFSYDEAGGWNGDIPYWDYGAYYHYGTDISPSEYFGYWEGLTSDDLPEHQADTGKDMSGVETNPMFNDISNGDYRLGETSPLCGIASDGGDIGALPCVVPIAVEENETTNVTGGMQKDTWYHTCFTLNGTHARIYRNGNVSSEPRLYTAPLQASATTVKIGIDNTLTDAFNGTIDDVFIWNRTLSAAEIVGLYNGTYTPEDYIYTNVLTDDYKRYEVSNGIWQIAQSDNGFGFDTNWIMTNTTTYLYDINYTVTYYQSEHHEGRPTLIFEPDYDIIKPTAENYEYIFKVKINGDEGYEQARLLVGSNTNYISIRKSKTRAYIDGSYVAGWGVTENVPMYVRFTINNSVCSWYQRNLSVTTWSLIYNDSCSYNINARFDCQATDCYFDNILYRELVPTSVESGLTFHPSFIYDSSNNTLIDKIQVALFRYGSNYSSVWDTTPTDFETNSNTLTGGLWKYVTYVYDILGNMAYNETQTIEVSTGTVNITIYDEQTEALINYTTVTINIYGDNVSASYSTATGNIVISDIVSGEYSVRYDATGYDPREYYVTIPQNDQVDIDLYLLNESESDRVILTLYNQDGELAPNITVKLQRNYISTGNLSIFKTVSMTRTNFEGQAALYVELYDVWYRLIYEHEGEVVKITTPSPFFSLTPEDIVNLLEDTYLSWREYDSLRGNLTFVNSSGQIYARFFYYDTNNLVRTGCLRVDRITPSGYTNVCYNCTDATSATISCAIDHTLTGQFKATALIDTNTTNSWYDFATDFYDVYDTVTFAQEGIFLSTIMIGTLALMGIGSVAGSILFMLIGIIGAVIMQFIVGFNISLIYWIVILGLIVIFMINRRET